jgi:hypothetical protein
MRLRTMRRPSRTIALLAVLIAAISVSWFDYALNRNVHQTRVREHREVIEGTALAPFHYRVLVPFSAELAIRGLTAIAGYDGAFRAVYALFYGAALLGLVIALQAYLELWFSRQQSLVGVLLMCCTLPIALRYHAFAPWSILEPVIMTVGLRWIATQQTVLIVPLTLVATLNRETAVLLPIAVLLDAIGANNMARRLSHALGAMAVWLATLLVVRYVRGSAADLLSLNAVWAMNRSAQGLKTAASSVPLFLGGTGWLLAVYGVATTPAFVRRMLWIILFYAPLYIVYGYWYEVRLLMPLYPVVVPAAVAGLARLDAA